MSGWFKRPIVIGPAERKPILIGPQDSLRIIPPRRGAWEEKGWRKHQRAGFEVYTGQFSARKNDRSVRCRFPGRIEIQRSGIAVFVQDPPEGIRTHPKSACFAYLQDGWFQLHWHLSPKNVDDALLYMERILAESL